MPSDLLHLPSWAFSAAGKPLELWSSEHKTEPPILFVGGVHGDEPEGVRLAQDFLFWLRQSHTRVEGLAEVHNRRPWILIPCLNPDGFENNERVNSSGVDLNRNFPTPDWSPDAKAPRYFPGTRPGSEPEVQALARLIEVKKPRLIVHFHSWEPCVVYTGAPGKIAATLLSPGPEYPVSEDIGYPTPGSLGQYGWLVHKIPVVCIEEQEKCNLADVWPHFGSGLQKLLDPKISI
jgi:hypothetical protein